MEVTVSYLFDVTENYQFKAKNLEIKKYPLRLGNTSKDFTIDNLKKKTGLKESVNFFLLIIDLLVLMKLLLSINI